MWHLSRQQQFIIGLVVFLLMTGWAVKVWRASHPPAPDPAHVRG